MNIDSDDILYSDAIITLVETAEAKNLDLIYGSMIYIDKYGSPYKPSKLVGSKYQFGYLIKNHGKNLFIDIDYKEGFTFDHVAEETVGVDYRYHKNFTGFYIDKFNEKKKVNYRMYVRDLILNVFTWIDKKLDRILYKNKAYEKKIFNGISFILIDIYQAYQAMVKDLKSKGGIIYPQKIKGLEDLATPIRWINYLIILKNLKAK